MLLQIPVIFDNVTRYLLRLEFDLKPVLQELSNMIQSNLVNIDKVNSKTHFFKTLIAPKYNLLSTVFWETKVVNECQNIQYQIKYIIFNLIRNLPKKTQKNV